MKRINVIISMLLGILMILLASCEKYSGLLEKEETGEMDLEKVFSDIRNAEQALSNCYNSLPAYITTDQNGSGKLKQTGLAETWSVYGSTSVAAANLQFPFNRGEWSESYGYTSSNQDRPIRFGDFYRFSCVIGASFLKEHGV